MSVKNLVQNIKRGSIITIHNNKEKTGRAKAVYLVVKKIASKGRPCNWQIKGVGEQTLLILEDTRTGETRICTAGTLVKTNYTVINSEK
jgi:hypothetical protein